MCMGSRVLSFSHVLIISYARVHTYAPVCMRRVLRGPEFTGVTFRQIREFGTVKSIILLDSALRAGIYIY